MVIPETMAGKKNIAHGLTVLLLLVLSGVAGCGYKTMPIPPEEILPMAITDLRYELDERGVTLNWTYPEETVRGDKLSDIESFKMFRAVVPADKYCENCPVPFGEPVLVEGGAIAPGKPKTGVYSSTLLRPRHIYFFKVRSGSGWWAESADSNIVSFMWDIPPASPQTLEAKALDGKVKLNWSGVATHIDGTAITEPIKYRILRQRGGGAFTPVDGLQSQPEFVDTGLINGRKYQYKVQAVTMYEKGQVSGGVSPVVSATPIDRTAPPAPAGVQGVRTAKGVKILWNQVDAPDLKGYRVYRRLPGESQPVMVGEVTAPSTLYDDTSMPDSYEWYYSVSSIDQAKPVNESKRSDEVKVRN